MKALIILLFVGANFFACDFRSLSHRAKSESDNSGASPVTDVCKEGDYQHKSEAELAAMTPAQLIDEETKEQLYHMPAGAGDPQPSLLLSYIRRSGIEVMPVLTEMANQYNPTTISRCEQVRFFVAFHTANNIDDVVVRIRTTKEGSSTIDALKRALLRMNEAGFDNEQQKRRDYDPYMGDLKRLQGEMITINDSIIQDTLRVKHDIQMSEEEMLRFSNFLTLLDPTYPSWSEMGEYSVPMVLKDSKRYYEAYLKFKARK